MVLTGEKTILRPATLDDRRKIFEWLTASDLTPELMGPPKFPEIEIPAWEDFMNDYTPQYFNDTNPEKGKSFIIEAEGEEVGQINYNDIDRINNTVELDIWLSGSSRTRKGFGTDAINTLCSFLHQTLRCNTFILAPSARNKNAIRAYEKCGFRQTDNVPDNFIPDYHDTVVMIKKA